MLRPYARLVDPAGHQRSPVRPAFQAFRPDGAQIGPVPLFAIKPIATLRAEAEATGEHALVRALGPLTSLTAPPCRPSWWAWCRTASSTSRRRWHTRWS